MLDCDGVQYDIMRAKLYHTMACAVGRHAANKGCALNAQKGAKARLRHIDGVGGMRAPAGDIGCMNRGGISVGGSAFTGKGLQRKSSSLAVCRHQLFQGCVLLYLELNNIAILTHHLASKNDEHLEGQ